MFNVSATLAGFTWIFAVSRVSPVARIADIICWKVRENVTYAVSPRFFPMFVQFPLNSTFFFTICLLSVDHWSVKLIFDTGQQRLSIWFLSDFFFVETFSSHSWLISLCFMSLLSRSKRHWISSDDVCLTIFRCELWIAVAEHMWWVWLACDEIIVNCQLTGEIADHEIIATRERMKGEREKIHIRRIRK